MSIDITILSFSFIQGILAFFAPCSVALLPGYISLFVTRKATTKKQMIGRALFLAGIIILGFLAIYAVAGLAIALFSPLIKQYISWVAIGMGLLIILFGILMLLGKNISFQFHVSFTKKNNELVEGFLFGIAYGIGALGCLFPLFLMVATSAIAAPSVVVGASYLVAYFGGMSLFMIAFTFLAIFSQEWLQKHLGKWLNYTMKISGVMLIIGGAYIIWYQSALLL